jgi:hypothetical protein
LFPSGSRVKGKGRAGKRFSARKAARTNLRINDQTIILSQAVEMIIGR